MGLVYAGNTSSQIFYNSAIKIFTKFVVKGLPGDLVVNPQEFLHPGHLLPGPSDQIVTVQEEHLIQGEVAQPVAHVTVVHAHVHACVFLVDLR